MNPVIAQIEFIFAVSQILLEFDIRRINVQARSTLPELFAEANRVYKPRPK